MGTSQLQPKYFGIGHALLAVLAAKGADHLMAATTDSIQQFIFSSLQEMNYETDGIDNDSELGPRGADLASLALVELALRVEEEFGVKFSEEEAEELAGKTVGEFCAIVAERLPAPGAPAV